jgi:hypothetical protein
MANIVQQFGNAVQKTCTKDPLKARRLLRIGYHAKIRAWKTQQRSQTGGAEHNIGDGGAAGSS